MWQDQPLKEKRDKPSSRVALSVEGGFRRALDANDCNIDKLRIDQDVQQESKPDKFFTESGPKTNVVNVYAFHNSLNKQSIVSYEKAQFCEFQPRNGQSTRHRQQVEERR